MKGASDHRVAGRALLIVAAILWSTNGIFIKIIHEDGAGPAGIVIAFYRSFMAALVFTVPAVRRFSGLRYTHWFIASILAFTLMTVTFIASTTLTTAANAIILQYTSVFWVFALSPLILGESADGLRGIFAGTLKEGADCTPRKLGDDASAGASLAACKDPEDIACLPKGLSWSCVARVDVGGDCFSDANCYLGLFCDNPDLRISGSACMERRIPTTACVTPNECTSLACTDGKCAEPGVQTAYCLL